MRTIARVLIAPLAVVALALPAAAQAHPPAPGEATKERTTALLKGLSFEPSALGRRQLGLFLGEKRLGTLTLHARGAPKGSGAVYELSVQASMEAPGPAGTNTIRFTQTALFDAAFALVRREGAHQGYERAYQGLVKRTRLLEQKDGAWHFTATFEGPKGAKNEATLTAPVEGRNHWDVNGLMLLAPLLDLKKPGRYALRGLHWPRLAASGWEGGGKPTWKAIILEVPKAGKLDVDGKARQGVRVKVTRGAETPHWFLIDTAKTLHGVDTRGVPVRMRLLKPKVDPKDVAAVRAAVRIYLRAMTGQAKPEALDAVMDWEALAKAQHLDKSLTGKTAAKIKAQIQAKCRAAELPEPLATMADEAQVTIVGDHATIQLTTSYSNILEVELWKHRDGWRLLTLIKKRWPDKRK